MKYSIGIGDMKVSNQKEDILITYSLGSCIGLTLYDPKAYVGAMIHCALPLAKTNPEEAKKRPARFIETGVPLLFQSVYDLGAQKDNLVIKVAGGGDMVGDNGTFKIGKRNYSILRKLLWKNNLLIKSEDVGGSKPRTMTLHLSTGRTTIKSGPEETEL